MLIEYETIEKIRGPLLFVRVDRPVKFGEMVVIYKEGEEIYGRVIEVSEDIAVIQVFKESQGLGKHSRVYFTDQLLEIGVSSEMLGRVFDGLARPIDGGPKIVYEEKLDVNGSAINPYMRKVPENFIETGISVIDVMNTLVRGQKLPLFSGSGLPHNRLAIQIARQANVKGEKFYVVFGAMGITAEEAMFFKKQFESFGEGKSVMFLNLASDPPIERLLVPRIALTTAEYLAYEQGAHVLVLLTDMTNYCNALREISAYREEIPGRRGYPGYLYTDLATIYERSGMIKGKKGSVTQMPFLTMPNDDITHPVPDLTGYITEGQIVLSRGLHSKGIYPPINPLPSLSRLMKEGIGEGKTREDHADVSNQLYAFYAEAMELRNLVAVVGEASLSKEDKRILHFADEFEERFISQGFYETRTIEESLEIAWDLLSMFPETELKKIKEEHIKKYYKGERDESKTNQK